MSKQAVVINENDSVATAAMNLEKGAMVSMFIGEKESSVTINSDIPFGHKFAIKSANIGDDILKYGESIGKATKNINKGDYVHVHNVESSRGRGDLEK